MKVSEFARQNSVSKMTVYRMVKKGLLPHRILPTGTIVILDDALIKPEHTAVYCRVSSTNEKGALDLQVERAVSFCNARGWGVDQLVIEYGLGTDDKRLALGKLLGDERVTRLVVERRDRLALPGFNYISILAEAEIVVINELAGSEDAS